MSSEPRAEGESQGPARHLLLAVGDREDSRRAVMYVADFFGGYRDLEVTLLTIVCEPPEDLFPGAGERARHLEEQRRAREALLEEYRAILVAGGLEGGRIARRVVVRPCASLADAILEEQDRLRCCILVVGRRGLSRNEEFLLGSTSSNILHRARRCAVMVVE